jgi:hypothetical protein
MIPDPLYLDDCSMRTLSEAIADWFNDDEYEGRRVDDLTAEIMGRVREHAVPLVIVEGLVDPLYFRKKIPA